MTSYQFRGNYINGSFTRPKTGNVIRSEDPGDLACPAGTIVSDPSAVQSACESAKKAFPKWKQLSPVERLNCLTRYQKAVNKRTKDLAWCISRETGKTLLESETEVRGMATKLDVMANQGLSLIQNKSIQMDEHTQGITQHRAHGIVGIIGPFNVPGHIANGQLIPSLLTGNTVVYKPSELTPFVGQIIAECLHAAGLPKGVFNLVQGDGRVGAALTTHSEVKVIFFTGSVNIGKNIHQLCAGNPQKLLALEMGGKNASIVMPDAPLSLAVKEIIHGAFATTGQRCSSTSRILLHPQAAKKFIQAFHQAVDELSIGYFTDQPFMGPLSQKGFVHKFLNAQKTADKLGYRTLKLGKKHSQGRNGHYVTPSIHLWESQTLPGTDKADYWDLELFAPNVDIYLIKSEEDLATFNNASQYGLVSSIFTSSRQKFNHLRDRLDNGVIHWNRSTAMTPGLLPFGGTKASGNHRPVGIHTPYICTYPVASIENNRK